MSKVLEGVVRANFIAKKMASGNLVEINTKTQSDALLTMNFISDYKAIVSPHQNLSTVQGSSLKMTCLTQQMLDTED